MTPCLCSPTEVLMTLLSDRHLPTRVAPRTAYHLLRSADGPGYDMWIVRCKAKDGSVTPRRIVARSANDAAHRARQEGCVPLYAVLSVMVKESDKEKWTERMKANGLPVLWCESIPGLEWMDKTL